MIAAVVLALAAAQPSLVFEERISAAGDRTQIFTFEVDAPRAEVWSALTTAEGWRRWAVPVAWQRGADPLIIETSYDAKAAPDGPQTIKQQFETLDPPRSLSFRTIKAPAGFPGFDTYRKVVTTFTLGERARGGTSITFEAGPFPDTEDGRKLYGFFRQGNRVTLEGLVRALSQAEGQ